MSRWALGWVVLFLFCGMASAQKEAAGAPSAAPLSMDDGPELVSGGDNPVVRYPVAHRHAAFGLVVSACGGWLYFSRDTIRYEVLGPSQYANHSFQFPRGQLTSAREKPAFLVRSGLAEFRFRGGGPYDFWMISKSAIRNAPSGVTPSPVESRGFQDLITAAMRFEDVAAMLIAREERLRPPPAPPPVISMLEPAGAEAGKSLEVGTATLHLRGIASHAKGIASVVVNGQTAYLKPLAPQTVEFDLRELPVNAGASAVVIVATSTENTQSQMIFTVNRAEVKVLEPAANFETQDEKIKVRGMAIGMPNVDRVEVAGVAAVLRPGPAGEVEFEAAGIPLQEGPNTLSGYVLTRNGTRQPFQIAVKRLPPPGPPALTLKELVDALHKGLPPTRVKALVAEYGVEFALTEEAEKSLREAGADSDLLLAVAKAKK